MTEQEKFLRNAMDTHGDTVYRLALCRTQNTADAEDVYQDVFLRLLAQAAQSQAWDRASTARFIERRSAGAKIDDEHLKAWLIRTTLNRCADLHRWRLRRPTLSLEELPDIVRPDDETAQLWEAVARLPEKLRTAVHLYYAEGYSTEEIAAMLDCPAATVRTRLRRARLKLKDLLGGVEDEREPVSQDDGDHSKARRAQ